MGKMRIVIDMQGIQTPSSKNRGVGRYTYEMVKEFILVSREKHEIYLVLNGAFLWDCIKIIDEFSALIPRKNIRCWQQNLTPVSGISGNDLGRSVSELIRECFIESLEPDVVWSTNLQEGWHDDAVTSVKRIPSKAFYVTTLHDVIPLLYPNTYLSSKIKPWYLEKIEYTKCSDLILTVSEFSKSKIIELLGVDSQKVHVAHNAISNTFTNSQETPKRTKSNYILYVGGADEHKNLKALVAAYGKLSLNLKEIYQLIFVGERLESAIIDCANKLQLDTTNFVFMTNVDDEGLVEIYQGASLFVYPSFSEGFGIPPLEAMACGAPVISSNAASLPEVIGLDEALFDPLNIGELAALMTKVLTDQKFKRKLKDHGIKQARKFNWSESAASILKLMETSFDFDRRVPNAINVPSVIAELVKIPHIEKSDIRSIATTLSCSFFAEDGGKPKRRLFLDISCYVHFDHATGIQRVVRSILNELDSTDLEYFDVVPIFSYAGHNNFYHVIKSDDKYCVPPDGNLKDAVVDFNFADILVFLDLHPGNGISKKNEILKLRTMGVLVYFVVYDLLPIEFPQYFVEDLSNEFAEWLGVCCMGDGVLTISKDVSDKFIKWQKKNRISVGPTFKVKHFYLGADIGVSLTKHIKTTDLSEFYEVSKEKKVFLIVGTLEPRKGHRLVLDSFERLWSKRNDVVLVFVGKIGWLNEELIKRLESLKDKQANFFWFSGISDLDLDSIYKASTCLIVASEGEGFGLPIIEGAQHGLPIIARDIPVFREVAGSHALYFDGSKQGALTDTIDQWLELYDSDMHPRSDHLPWISWEESCKMFIEAIQF